MSVREVVNVQCGAYSNFIGAHWWNLQVGSTRNDEDNEILDTCMFRNTKAGLRTPRLLALDLPGNFSSSLPSTNSRTAGEGLKPGIVTRAESSWEGKLEKYAVEEPPCKKASREAKCWSEVRLETALWHKTALSVPLFVSEEMPSGLHSSGLAVWKQIGEEVEDRLRLLMEECEQPQGFHLLVDWDSGFGGVAACLSQLLQDEYASKSVFAVASSAPHNTFTSSLEKSPDGRLNVALCLDALASHCSLVCPLSMYSDPWSSSSSSSLPRSRVLPYVVYEPTSPHHTSALLACLLDTASLPYRTGSLSPSSSSSSSLSSLCGQLALLGRKVCAGSLTLPLGTEPRPPSLLTPYCDPSDAVWTQCVSVRGVQQQSNCGSKLAACLVQTPLPSQPFKHCTADIMAACLVQTPLPVPSSFPNIIPTAPPLITSTSSPPSSSSSIPMSAGLHCQFGAGVLVRKVREGVPFSRRMHVPHTQTAASGFVEQDRLVELEHSLSDLFECYRDSPGTEEAEMDGSD